MLQIESMLAKHIIHKRPHTVWSDFYEMSRIVRFMGSGLMVAWGWGGGEIGEWMVMGKEFLFEMIKMF